MVTAVGQKIVIERAEELGISGYITKPFDDAKIKETLEKTYQML
jgi:AmiR/NasT family two-component response regulator